MNFLTCKEFAFIVFLFVGLYLNKFVAAIGQTSSYKRFFTAADALTRLESPELKQATTAEANVFTGSNESLGIWSRWQYCPKYSYINALQIQKNSNGLITGLQLNCANHLTEPKQTHVFTLGTFLTIENALISNLATRSKYYTNNGLRASCGLNGRSVGLQLEIGSQKQSDAPENGVYLNHGLYSINLFCLSSSQSFSVSGPFKNLQYLTESLGPQLCDKGEYVCGVQVQEKGTNIPGGSRQGKILSNINMRCCAGEVGESFIIPRRDNRNAIGKVLKAQLYSEQQLKSLGKFYNTAKFDEPFWYRWNFCPPNTYVVGFQLATVHRRVRLLCASSNDIKSYKTVDENIIEDEIYTKKTICNGFGVGFQVELIPEEGITNLRMFCSSLISMGTNQNLKLVQTYIDQEGFKEVNGTKFVGRPHFCKSNEALCGMKLMRPDFHSTIKQFHDIKMKCCRVPDRTELCQPSDEFQLIVECDASEALSHTTCTYKKHIGISITKTLSKNEKVERDLREGLTYDRSITDGTSSTDSTSQSKGITNTQSGSRSITNTGTASKSEQISNSDSTSIGSSSSATDSNSKSQSSSTGTHSSSSHSSGSSLTTGSEKTNGKINIDSVNYKEGSLLSNSIGNAIALTSSQSESSSKSNTQEISHSKMTGQSHSNSQSTSSSQTDRSSQSNTRGSSDTQSSSSSNTHGWNFEAGISAKVEANFLFASASVETSFKAGAHGSYTTGSDRSQGTNSQLSKESGRDLSSSTGSEYSSSRQSQNTVNEGSSSSRSSTNERQQGKSNTQTKDSTTSLNKEHGKDSSKQVSHQESTSESRQTNTQDTSESGSSSSTNTGSETSNSKSTGQSSDKSRQQSWSQNVDYSKGTSASESQDNSKQTDSRLTFESSSGRNSQLGSTSGQSKSIGFTTGYDWSSATSDVFTMEETLDVALTVPPGMITRLYQVVGYCSYYTVRATVLKRVDIGEDHEQFIEDLKIQAGETQVELETCEAKLQTCTVDGSSMDAGKRYQINATESVVLDEEE